MAVVTKGLGLLGDAFEGAIRSAREVYDDLSVEEIYKHLTDERYGKGRVGELERMQNLVTRKNKTGNFAGNPISIADLEGRGFITSMADRSDAGGLLTHIKGVELETPIDLLGGQGFMFNNQEAWAQAQGAGSGIKNVGKKLRKTTGQNPILIPNRMAPTGGDFAGFNGEAMLSFAQSNMTGKQKDLLNKQMKKLIPSWKGIDSPTSLSDFQALPKVGRDAVMNMLDTKFRNNGGLSIGEGRLATTEAGQINAPDTRIQNIAELDLNAPMGLVNHPAYTHGMAGRGLGTVKEDVPAFALNPQSVQEMREGFNRPVADVFNPTPQDVRSLQMGAKGGIITEGLLRRLDDLGVLGSTAIGTGGLLASMNSQAGEMEGQYDPTSMSSVLGISPEMMTAMSQRDALDQQRMTADEQRYGQYADDQMMPREQTYSEQLGNYLAGLHYGNDDSRSQAYFAQNISNILDFTPVGSVDALKLGAQQREAGNSFEGWLNSIGGAAEAAIPLAGLGYKYGKKGVQGLMEAF